MTIKSSSIDQQHTKEIRSTAIDTVNCGGRDIAVSSVHTHHTPLHTICPVEIFTVYTNDADCIVRDGICRRISVSPGGTQDAVDVRSRHRRK